MVGGIPPSICCSLPKKSSDNPYPEVLDFLLRIPLCKQSSNEYFDFQIFKL